MEYRLTKLGKIVAFLSSSLLIFTIIIIAVCFNHQKLDSNYNQEANNIQNSEINNTAPVNNNAVDSTYTQKKPKEPIVIEVKDNTDVLKNMKLDVYFGPNVAVLEENNYEALNLFIDTAKILEGSFIQVEGNCATALSASEASSTENEQNNQYNYILSLRRAEAIADYMIKKGISKDRLIVVGNGSSKPIKSNDKIENRKYNRRVDVFFKTVEN